MYVVGETNSQKKKNVLISLHSPKFSLNLPTLSHSPEGREKDKDKEKEKKKGDPDRTDVDIREAHFDLGTFFSIP